MPTCGGCWKPARGGWNLHNTNFPAAAIANPAVSPIIRMNGDRAWFGWPSDAKHEELRTKWALAPTLDARKAVARELQELEVALPRPLQRLQPHLQVPVRLRHVLRRHPSVGASRTLRHRANAGRTDP